MERIEIDKKIRLSHSLRRIVTGAEAAAVGTVGYIASTLPPEYRLAVFVPLIALVLMGAGVVGSLENNEKRLQSSNKEAPEGVK